MNYCYIYSKREKWITRVGRGIQTVGTKAYERLGAGADLHQVK
jgi:hypothetical protein